MSNREMPSMPVKPSEQSEVPAKALKIEPKSNEIVVSPKSTRSIQVVATEKGFYKQMRKAPGDEFAVEKFEQLGSWMKCVDPVMEKKRLDLMKDHKLLRKAASKPEAGE